MNRIQKALICLISFILPSGVMQAQEDRSPGMIKSALIGLEYQVKAGLSIGGTAPLPMPVEIRAIDGFNPTILFSIEGNATKWLKCNDKWGARLGLRLENKGMITHSQVRNYGMEIHGDAGELIAGRWTGDVKTRVRNAYLTVPISAVYRIHKRFNVTLGPYVSYMIEGDFSGDVSNGYLREGDPTGNKVIFEDDKSATYNFSKNLRRFQWGAQLGGEWRALNHLNVYADLTWGFNDIFKSNFHTITFPLYPIYLNLGFAYVF